MSLPFYPSEIYLLHRYVSLDYFGVMRDCYASCISASEEALEYFMGRLPRDFRSRPINSQPDAVWGARVIPNMRDLLHPLNSAYARISHGELAALAVGASVGSVFTSIGRDFDSGWMPESCREAFDRERRDSLVMASNIYHTYLCTWEPGDLGVDYNERVRGPLRPPTSWPIYRLNRNVKTSSGQVVAVSGAYIPGIDGCPQYLIAGQEACRMLPPYPKDDYRVLTYDERAIPTTWTLVEKIADSGGGIPGASDPWLAGIRERCIAGEPCPRTGWWTTPAAPARRRFVAGTVMPELGGDWGTTVWQLEQPD